MQLTLEKQQLIAYARYLLFTCYRIDEEDGLCYFRSPAGKDGVQVVIEGYSGLLVVVGSERNWPWIMKHLAMTDIYVRTTL